MPFDVDRIIRAAAEAALDEPSSKPQARSNGRHRRLSVPKGFLIGAGLVTAGRLIVRARSENLLQNLQEKLVELEDRHFGTVEEAGDWPVEDDSLEEDDLPEEDEEEPEDDEELPEEDEPPEEDDEDG